MSTKKTTRGKRTTKMTGDELQDLEGKRDVQHIEMGNLIDASAFEVDALAPSTPTYRYHIGLRCEQPFLDEDYLKLHKGKHVDEMPTRLKNGAGVCGLTAGGQSFPLRTYNLRRPGPGSGENSNVLVPGPELAGSIVRVTREQAIAMAGAIQRTWLRPVTAGLPPRDKHGDPYLPRCVTFQAIRVPKPSEIERMKENGTLYKVPKRRADYRAAAELVYMILIDDDYRQPLFDEVDWSSLPSVAEAGIELPNPEPEAVA